MLKMVIDLLEDRERTPAWLCRKAGISHALFIRMNNGERTITEETKNKFSEILGIRKEILFNNEPKGDQ
tara:strand:+ start:757 stop:963 length:207 start_codon:yes stop_codon:yes gene_type:complete